MKQLIPILIIVVLIFIIRNIVLSIHSVITSQHTISSLERQASEQKKDNIFLRERLKYVQGNQYVEQEAREKLGLVKYGELVVLVPSHASQAPTPVVHIDNRANWRKWWEVFF